MRYARFGAVLLLAVAASGAGCIATAPPRSAGGVDRPPPLPYRLAGIATVLAGQGFEPGPWIEGHLAAGMHLSLSYEAPHASRIAIVAVGDPEALSLDLRALDASTGVEIASDVSRGRRAAASFPLRGGDVVDVVASAVAGEGRALVALFEAPPGEQPPSLAGLFDADGAGSRAEWSSLVGPLVAEGYALSADATDFEADYRTFRAFPFAAVAGRCYVVAAMGSPGIDSVVLRLQDGDALLSADLSGRREAFAAWCAERDFQLTATVSGVVGSGVLRLGLFSALREDVVGAVGPPLRAPRHPVLPDSALRREGAVLEGRGFCDAERLESFYSVEAGERLPIALPEGLAGCYALSAAADGDRGDLHLGLSLAPRSGGAPVVVESRDGPATSAAVCHGDAFVPSASVTSLRGAEKISLELRRLPWTPPSSEGFSLDTSLPEAAARFAREGLSELVGRFELTACDAGFCASRRLAGGRCYGAAILADGGRVTRFEAVDRSRSSSSSARRGGVHVTDFAWCLEEDADYDFEAVLDEASTAPPSMALFSQRRDKPLGAK